MGILNSDIVRGVVNCVLWNLVESSGSLQGIILMVVVVILPTYIFEKNTFDVPLLAWLTISRQSFWTIIGSSRFGKPVGLDDSATVIRVAAEAAVFLVREVQVSFVVNDVVIASSMLQLEYSSAIPVCSTVLSGDKLLVVIGINIDLAISFSWNNSKRGFLVEFSFVLVGEDWNVNRAGNAEDC